MNDKTLTKISKLADQYDGKVMERRKAAQTKLKEMVQKHDLTAVAIAGGWTISTLSQYIRVKTPGPISESALIKAETVLKQADL